MAELNDEVVRLRAERDALAEAIRVLKADCTCPQFNATWSSYKVDPSVILAARDARVKAQALREAAAVCHGYHHGCEREILEMAAAIEKEPKE